MIAAMVFGLSLLALSGVAWETGRDNVAYALTNCGTGSAALTGEELVLLELINGARASVGFPSVQASPNLSRAAAWKSEDSSASSHTDSLGRSPSTRAQQCGYGGGAAENIAWGGYSSAQSVFTAWMNSLGHRCNINGTVPPGTPPDVTCAGPPGGPPYSAGYTVVGIGYAGSSWTLNFGFVDDSGDPWDTDTPPPPPPATNPPTQPSFPTNPPATSTPTTSGPSAAAPAPTSTPTASPTYWNPNAHVYPGVVPRVSMPMLARQ